MVEGSIWITKYMNFISFILPCKRGEKVIPSAHLFGQGSPIPFPVMSVEKERKHCRILVFLTYSVNLNCCVKSTHLEIKEFALSSTFKINISLQSVEFTEYKKLYLEALSCKCSISIVIIIVSLSQSLAV